MVNLRKNLKIISILILVLVVFSLARMIVDVCKNGFGDIGELPKGVSPEVGEVLVVIVWAIGVLFLLPQVYIGIKGIKLATNPSSVTGRAHLVWAAVMTILSGLSVISCISKISQGYTSEKFWSLFDVLLNVLVFCTYYYCARKIATEANK